MKKRKFDEFNRMKTNREERLETNKSTFWCPKCDLDRIGKKGKCSTCGFRENNK